MPLPAGAIEQPPLEVPLVLQWIRHVRCPYCGTANVRYAGNKDLVDGDRMRYYNCRLCAKQSGKWSRFRVVEER